MKLKELGTIIRGKTPPTDAPAYWNGDIPFVTTKDLRSAKHIFTTERNLTEEGCRLSPNLILPKNAVCVSCVGTLGYVGMTTQVCRSNQQINAIAANEDNDPDYIYYLIRSLWDYFKQNEGRSTVTPLLNKKQFGDIEVNVPTLQKQRETARILSPFDELWELNELKAKNLWEQIRTVYRYFTSKNTHTVRLDELCDIRPGKHNVDTENDAYFGGDIKWLRTQDIAGSFVEQTSKTLTEEGFRSIPKYGELFRPDTIALSVIGTVGQAAVIGEPMCANGSIVNIEPHDPEALGLIFTFICEQKEHLNSAATGSVIKRVTADKIRELRVPVGSDSEKDRLIRLIQPFFAALRLIDKQNKAIALSRDTAIAKLFENVR